MSRFRLLYRCQMCGEFIKDEDVIEGLPQRALRRARDNAEERDAALHACVNGDRGVLLFLGAKVEDVKR